MNVCENCPYPRRCEPQGRCIAYKKDAKPAIMTEPTPVPVLTSTGISMTGFIKKPAKKKAKKYEV